MIITVFRLSVVVVECINWYEKYLSGIPLKYRILTKGQTQVDKDDYDILILHMRKHYIYDMLLGNWKSYD